MQGWHCGLLAPWHALCHCWKRDIGNMELDVSTKNSGHFGDDFEAREVMFEVLGAVVD